MKKLVAVALTAGLLSVLGAQAASAQLLDAGTGDLTAGVFPEGEFAALSGSGHPFAVGGGKTITEQFAFSARNGPTGPSGYAVIKTPLYEAQGHVICYLGNTALPEANAAGFTIRIEKASGFLAEGSRLHILVDDSGQPGGTGDAIVLQLPPLPCIAGDFIIGGGLVTQGNVVVKN
jgi:hypothetical protein